MANVTENAYRIAHKKKVEQLYERINQYTEKHNVVLPSDISPARMRGRPTEDEKVLGLEPGVQM